MAAGDTRERILTAATDLFGLRGVDAVSLVKISSVLVISIEV